MCRLLTTTGLERNSSVTTLGSVSDISGARGSYSVELPGVEDGAQHRVSLIVPPGRGLAPAEVEHLVSSIEAFVYPADAPRRDYNSLAGTSSACSLPAVSYTIAFHANGGTGAMPDQAPVRYGSSDAISRCRFSVENMAFRHWSTDSADQASADGTRADGQAVGDLPAVEGGTVMLYAQWGIGLAIRSENDREEPVAGARYRLNATADGGAIDGLFFDPDRTRPIRWPVITGEDGTFCAWWLPTGTCYLASDGAPAGYDAAPSPIAVDIAVRDGRSAVTVGGIEVSGYSDLAAHMTVSYTRPPALPGTGGLPAASLRGTGALAAVGAAVALAWLALRGRTQ